MPAPLLNSAFSAIRSGMSKAPDMSGYAGAGGAEKWMAESGGNMDQYNQQMKAYKGQGQGQPPPQGQPPSKQGGQGASYAMPRPAPQNGQEQRTAPPPPPPPQPGGGGSFMDRFRNIAQASAGLPTSGGDALLSAVTGIPGLGSIASMLGGLFGGGPMRGPSAADGQRINAERLAAAQGDPNAPQGYGGYGG